MIETLLTYAVPITAVINIMVGGFMWVLRASFVRQADFTVLEGRVHKIENEMAHLPSHRHVSDLALTVEKLHGEIKAFEARLQGLHEVLKRVERPLNLMLEQQLDHDK